MGIKALRKIQTGKESTAGQAVAATAIWRGVGTIEDRLNLAFAPEDVGYLGGLDRTYISHYEAGLTMGDTPATFEQLPYILMAGVKDVSGAADNAVYTLTFDFPTTAQNTPQTFTVEAGDDALAEEFAYAHVSEWRLSGRPREALMMSATWRGRQVSTTTFTGSLAAPTVEEILFGKGLLYINAANEAFGATVKSATLLGMDFRCTSGFAPVESADGAAYFATLKQINPEYLLDLTYEHNSVATTEKAAWRAQTPRKIQLKWTGSAVSGTAYTVKTLILNLVGKYESFSVLDEMNGNDIVRATFRGRYNATAATLGQIIVGGYAAADVP